MLYLQEMFDMDLIDHEHTASRLKNRANPTKYLNYLLKCAKNWIRRSDD